VLAINLLTPDRSLQPVFVSNIDTSPEKQIVRKKLINKLKKTGVIDKIETAENRSYVYIGERFTSLKKDEIENFMSTISDYYYTLNKKTTMVIIKDPKTNKKIGKYSQNGLSMKKND
jgi:hypothetical protein